MEGFNHRKEDLFQMNKSTKSMGRPPEKSILSTSKNKEDFRNEKEFSPPDIHWRDALKRMNREVNKVQSLPPIENLLETTPCIVKSSLEIREKYFNKKNEDLIRRARGIFDTPITTRNRFKNIISLCFANLMILNDDAFAIDECKHLEQCDLCLEFVSVTIMEDLICFDRINVLDLNKVIKTFFCNDSLISCKYKAMDPSKPKKTNNNNNTKSKMSRSHNKAGFSDWRSELKSRGKFGNNTKFMEEIQLGIPEYKAPFRSNAIITDWRDVIKSKMENIEENDPFLKWNKLDQSANKSNGNKKKIKLKSPNIKARNIEESNQFSEDSQTSIFGKRMKLRPSNKDRPLVKESVKKTTTKIINFVAISVTEETQKAGSEVDNNFPMDTKLDETASLSENSKEVQNNKNETDKSQRCKIETIPDCDSTDNCRNNSKSIINVNTSNDIAQKDKPSDKLSYSQHSASLCQKDNPSTLSATSEDASGVRSFKFSEEKRNFLVDNYFLGTLYIGPQKSMFNESQNPLRSVLI